jgi:hypothetical protein
MEVIIAALIAGVAWFLAAAVCFFNPVIDPLYRAAEDAPGVRSLPQNGRTVGMILCAIFVQTILWAFVYSWIKGGLPESITARGVIFGGIICFMKIIPRDIDRLLLSEYPPVRMKVEFVVGILCAFVVSFTYAFML